MSEQVKFKKGLSTSTLPDPEAGSFLVETDTGTMYLDTTEDLSGRVQIQDNTKLPLTGGTIGSAAEDPRTTSLQPGELSVISSAYPDYGFAISATNGSSQISFKRGSATIATIPPTGDYLIVSYDYTSPNPGIGSAVTNKDYVDTSIQSNAVPATTTDNTNYTVDKNVNFTGTTEVGALSVGTINATGNLTLSDSAKSQWQSVLGVGSGGGGDYLPLAGGTLSGNVIINNTSDDAQVSLQGLMAQGQISASSSIAPVDRTISFNYRSSSSQGWSTIFSYGSTGVDMKNNSITNYVIDDGSID